MPPSIRVLYGKANSLHDNPADTFVGARFAEFLSGDSTKLVFFCDGEVKSHLDWEKQKIPVDSFQNNRCQYRAVYPPFFTYVKIEKSE